ncbi:MAG: T9SS type A sorting domain-containing protein [Chitinophagaceae bacterium]|nr:T9SS type A sorting domain-containing protein [Chitinophagaceae bacterium]
MWQKYILTISVLFSINNVQGQQLYLDLYQTIGEDTSIQCMDATDAYSIWGTELWVGTDKGLFNISNSGKVLFDSFNSPLPDNDITAVDESNDVWVGTNHGICRIDMPSVSWNCYNTSNSSLTSDSITSILAIGYDSVWIGTRNGLVLYTSLNDTFESFTALNSLLPGNNIQCLERYYFNPDQNYQKPLYVGTDSGMVIINGNNWKVYTTINSPLTSNDIRSLAIDDFHFPDLSLWIGSYGGGIIHLDDTAWTSYCTNNQLIKTDSLDFTAFIWFGEITGSKSDSLYLRAEGYEDEFQTFQSDISNPLTAVSINRGNGSWLWVATANEIYRGDFTGSINSISSAIPKWKASIEGNKLILSEIPVSTEKLILKIYDLTGKCYFQQQFVNYSHSSNMFDIPELSTSTYIVQLQQSNKIETVKVIKAK